MTHGATPNPPPIAHTEDRADAQADAQAEDGPILQPPATIRQFPCASCGAKLVYAPGPAAMTCPYCGHETPVADDGAGVLELDMRAYLAIAQAQLEEKAQLEAQARDYAQGRDNDQTPGTVVSTARCRGCAAELELPAHLDAFGCPYCDHPVVATGASPRAIRPGAVLPFSVPMAEARDRYRAWVRRLWFAPGSLKRRAKLDAELKGLYIPAWTFDSQTTTRYTGQRGDHYWVTERYSTTENGRSVTRTRQVRRTRWSGASGVVRVPFDDVLVLASGATPPGLTERLEPWDLKNLEPYRDEYLAGYTAHRDEIGLAAGFEAAEKKMDPLIRAAIHSDIGGDEQRISTMRVRHEAVTFKHLLLPVWISAYRHNRKVYRFVVNARTGEVHGQRPWSVWKVSLAVLGVLATAGLIALIALSAAGE